MKTHTYWIILTIAVITFTLIGYYGNYGITYWLWTGGATVLYVLCYKDFTKRKYSQPTGVRTISPNANIPADQIAIQDLQAGYEELFQWCLPADRRSEIEPFLKALAAGKSHGDRNEWLYSVAEQAEMNGAPFISILDWKAPVEDLIWKLSEQPMVAASELAVVFPMPERYPARSAIHHDNVLLNFDDSLRAANLQLGIINTHSDQYIIIVHNVTSRAVVAKAVKLIGFVYNDMEVELSAKIKSRT